MIIRNLIHNLYESLNEMPVTALLGARQVGKTTLALNVAKTLKSKEYIYLDLESDLDLAKLTSPEEYLLRHNDKLIIIDEVHRNPDLFRTLRSIVDKRRREGQKAGHFLLLGSSSKDLLQSTSESLAGRIRYLELTPFVVSEVQESNSSENNIDKLWFRGGFPDSYLADSNKTSWNWRGDFIATYIQQDIPFMGPQVSATRMKRFWSMLAHYHGQTVVLSELGRNLEVSHTTIRTYLDLLSDFYMVRQLQPWHGNSKKRLVKTPKIYVRDSGLLHRLLNIQTFEELLGNPAIGSSWEGFVIENVIQHLPENWQYFYYRTSTQQEIDLVIESDKKERWAIEIKRSSSPTLSKGFHKASEDIGASRKYAIYAGRESYPLGNDVEVVGLEEFLSELNQRK